MIQLHSQSIFPALKGNLTPEPPIFDGKNQHFRRFSQISSRKPTSHWALTPGGQVWLLSPAWRALSTSPPRAALRGGHHQTWRQKYLMIPEESENGHIIIRTIYIYICIYICIYIYVYIHAIKFTYITHAYIICTPKNGEKRIWIDETPHAIKSHIDIAAGPFPLQAMSTLSIDHSAFGRVLCECFPFGNHRLKPSLPRTWPRKNHTLLQCVCVCACVCLSAKYYVYLENHPI